MDKYIMQLFDEYMDAVNFRNEKMFFEWLNYKEIHIERYYEFLKLFGLEFNKPVVELGMGKLDTLSLSISTDEKIIEISPYALDIRKDNVDSYNGVLKIINDKPKIETKSCYVDIDDSLTYIKKIPILDNTIYNLLKINKEVFIGFYSSITDCDIQAKKIWLEIVKNKLNEQNINYSIEEATTYDTYMCAIKAKKLLKK